MRHSGQFDVVWRFEHKKATSRHVARIVPCRLVFMPLPCYGSSIGVLRNVWNVEALAFLLPLSPLAWFTVDKKRDMWKVVEKVG